MKLQFLISVEAESGYDLQKFEERLWSEMDNKGLTVTHVDIIEMEEANGG